MAAGLGLYPPVAEEHFRQLFTILLTIGTLTSGLFFVYVVPACSTYFWIGIMETFSYVAKLRFLLFLK